MTASTRRRGSVEKQFLQQVRDLARLCGWATFHPLDSRGSEPGWPDLTLVRGERLVFAELKAPKGWVRPEQRAWLEKLGRVPCAEVFVWRPVDWSEIEATLRR